MALHIDDAAFIELSYIEELELMLRVARPNAEVRAVRTKNRVALIKSTLLEVASHAAMGVAVGLAFAFILTHIAAFGIAALINLSRAPDALMQMFVSTCAISFGIGGTLTGLAITFAGKS
jgi:DUF971 family protein